MLRPQPVNTPGIDGSAQEFIHFVLGVRAFLGIPEEQGAQTQDRMITRGRC